MKDILPTEKEMIFLALQFNGLLEYKFNNKMNRFGLSFVIHIKMKQTKSTFLKGESSILIITKMNSPETCKVTLIIQKN